MPADKITLDDLLASEHEVLSRIANELNAEMHEPLSSHSSHSSGHSSSGGHNSVTARIETPDGADK